MTKDEALRLALEALESAIPKYTRQRKDQKTLGGSLDYWKLAQHQRMKAITAIKAALEAKDEPVVWNEGVPAMLPKQKEGETFIVSYEPNQEAKGEPVAWAWRVFDPDEGHDGKWGSWHISDYKPPRQQSRWFQVVPLPSTTPPQRKPLTDEEIQQIFIANSVVVDNGNAYMVAGLRTVNIARAIEAAHGIKGEA